MKAVDDGDSLLEIGPSGHLAPERAFECWRQELSSLFTTDTVTDRQDFKGRLRVHNLGSLLIGHARSTSLAGYRDQPLIADADIDHILVRLHLEGTAEVEAGDGVVHVDAGDLICLDLARPFSFRTSEVETIAIVLPRMSLDVHPRIFDELHGSVMSGGTTLGRMLGHHLDVTDRLAGGITSDERAPVAQATSRMLSAFLSWRSTSEGRPGRNGTVSTLEAILRMIERNLTDPSLSPETVMREFGLSRSALYRLFRDEGGIAQYIRDKRLRRVHSLLLMVPANYRGTKRLAIRAGFPNEATFARAFRTKFGYSHAEALERARTPSSSDAHRVPAQNVSKLRTWLERLSING